MVCGSTRPTVLQPGIELLDGQWATDAEPLRQVAPKQSETILDFVGLHSFGDDLVAEVVPEIDR